MSSSNGSSNAAGSSGGHSEGNSASPHLDSRSVVLQADIVLLFLILLIVFWRLPRAVARFSHSSAWVQGHFFKKITGTVPVPSMFKADIYLTSPVSPKDDSASVSEEYVAWSESTHSEQSTVKTKTLKQSYILPNYPVHITSSPRFLRTAAVILQTRIVPGWTGGQSILLGFYLFFLIWASLYESNPFTDALREGWLIMAQVPFVFAFASKNNIIGSFLGMGYEKLNFVHRFMARLLVVWADIHTAGYFYKWGIAGTTRYQMTQIGNIWGMVVLVAMNVMFFFSTEFWRKRAYRLFLGTHILAILVFLPGVWYHNPAQMPYVVIALLVYGLDRICRGLKSRITEATLRPIPELGVTRVEIPGINGGWTAGQHVRLRVLSSCMGPFGWAEIHPFTIASVSGSPEGLVLMCKKAGSWTHKLYKAAQAGGDGESAGIARKVKVHVEGPYGGTGHTVIPSFSGAMIVGGGSGITFPLSAVQDLLQKDRTGESRVKTINLVWTIQDPSSLKPLLPTFTAMLAAATHTSLTISVYYTRPQPLEKKLPFDQYLLPPGLALHSGRPKLGKVLNGVIAQTMMTQGGPKDVEGLKGIFVGVCGPVGLGDECAKAVGMIDSAKRDEVGGVELHEEVFGW